MKILKFEDVQLNTIGQDYCDESVIILDKGTTKEMFEKHEHESCVGLADFLDGAESEEMEDALNEPAVFVKMEDGDTTIFSYGGYGVAVYIQNL